MTFALASHVSVTETEDGMVLLDERAGRYWQLNGTGATVVRLLLEGNPLHEVVSGLRERYPGAADRVTADVGALLRALKEARMVTS